jgi:hypothetical protein
VPRELIFLFFYRPVYREPHSLLWSSQTLTLFSPESRHKQILIIRMIRTKGEAGTGDVVEAVRHQRTVMSDIRRAAAMSDEELYAFAKELAAPYHLLKETARLKRLPVVS